MSKFIRMAAAAALLAAAPAYSAPAPNGKNYCGELKNAMGPYDYRVAPPGVLAAVEGGHFGAEVEAGVRGQTGSGIGPDLDYTLRALPNHHRALQTVLRFALRNKKQYLSGGKRPLECYFERAIRFQPDDGIAHGIYAAYLYGTGRTDAALESYLRAVELMPADASLNYNVGLLYLNRKNYERANHYAQRAYAQGIPLPGLKDKLLQAGKWDSDAAPLPEPAPAGAAAPEPAVPPPVQQQQ